MNTTITPSEINTANGQSAGISMKELLSGSEFTLPKIGSVLKGKIISTGNSSVLIDLGTLGTGIVYPGEFYDNPTLQKALKPGQEVSAILLDLEDEESSGYRELSLKQAQQTTAWGDIREKKEKGEIITTKITNINKGGLMVEINGIQGFLPLSQLASEHYPKVEGGDTSKIVQTLQKYRNQDFRVKVIDFSEQENKLIVSEKAVEENKLKKELSHFSVGDIVEGKITDVTDFGAFMLIEPPKQPQEESEKEETEGGDAIAPRGKVEGLIHISEIDWKMIDDPRKILSSGQKVKAKIINIENNKISLSLKALKDDPWLNAEDKYKAGQEVTGKIAKTTNYGALISFDDGITGLVPISEFRGKRPSDMLQTGENCDAIILSFNPQEHKMLLKLKIKENAGFPKEQDEKSAGEVPNKAE